MAGPRYTLTQRSSRSKDGLGLVRLIDVGLHGDTTAHFFWLLLESLSVIFGLRHTGQSRSNFNTDIPTVQNTRK